MPLCQEQTDAAVGLAEELIDKLNEQPRAVGAILLACLLATQAVLERIASLDSPEGPSEVFQELRALISDHITAATRGHEIRPRTGRPN